MYPNGRNHNPNWDQSSASTARALLGCTTKSLSPAVVQLNLNKVSNQAIDLVAEGSRQFTEPGKALPLEGIYAWEPSGTPQSPPTRSSESLLHNPASMSQPTSSDVVNRPPTLSTQDKPDYGVDALTEGISRLALPRDPLLSFDPTDKSLRLTSTSSTGNIMLYSNSNEREGNILKEWKLTGWRDKVAKKTLSVLIMGHNLHPKVAKSGWARSLNQDRDNDAYSPINGSIYTEKAWQLCRLLKCDLVVNRAIEPRDRDRPGYFEASHAEMHLITWFVETYFPRLLKDGSTARRVGLPQSLDNVLIISNRGPYPSCLKLAARVKELTGVTITISYRELNM